MEVKGLDISQWQEGLNLSNLKSSGYDFLILRGGYTGYGASRKKNKDYCFENFYNQAKANNIPVGAYWYSCANDAKTGMEEAEFFYKMCLAGKAFEYPVYIDVEDSTWQTQNKKGVTDAVIAFCEYLEEQKFYVGLYASLSWFNERLESERLNNYTKWVASWSANKPQFKWNGFHLWQNSDSGKYNGEKVDTNVCYEDFPSIIKKACLNGFNSPQKVPEPGGEVKIVYIVKPGDTLSAIALKYKTTVDSLVKKNNIKNPDLIYPNQQIKI